MLKIILALLVLTGCGTLNKEADSTSALQTAVGTAAVIKTVEKIKEVFTPHFPLLVFPSEICDISEDPVVCYVVPCANGPCENKVDRQEWLNNNPKVVTIEASMVVEMTKFCKKIQMPARSILDILKAEK